MSEAIEQWLAARKEMTPARTASVARFLGAQPDDWYGMLPFAPVRDAEGKWWIAAAVLPPPLLLGPPEEVLEHFGDGEKAVPFTRIATEAEQIGDIVWIEPASGSGHPAKLPAEDHCLVGSQSLWEQCEGVVSIYSNGQQWAHDWCEARTKWYMDARWTNDVIKAEPPSQLLPGYLLVGDVDLVRNWVDVSFAGQIVSKTPALVRPIQSAILKSANLPKVTSPALKSVK